MSRFTRTAGPSPNITMAEILESWENKTLEVPHEFKKIFKLLPEKIDDEGIETIKKELLEIEEHSKKTKIPLWEIRKALMDATGEYYCINTFLEIDDDIREQCYENDIFVDLREVGFHQASLLALKWIFEIMILRLYSSMKYNDAVSEGHEDWFTFYTEFTENRWGTLMKFITAEDDGQPVSWKWIYGLMTKTYNENIEKARQTCLTAIPRTPLKESTKKSMEPSSEG